MHLHCALMLSISAIPNLKNKIFHKVTCIISKYFRKAILGREFLNPLFYEDPPTLPTPLFRFFSKRPTQPYKYILTAPVMCSHLLPDQLYVLNRMNNSLISKICFTEFHNFSFFFFFFFSKFTHVQKSRIC